MLFLLMRLTHSNNQGLFHELRVYKPNRGFYTILAPSGFFRTYKSLKKFLKKLVYSKNKPNRSFIYFLPFFQLNPSLSFMPFSKNHLSNQSLRFLGISKDPYRQRIFVTCIIRQVASFYHVNEIFHKYVKQNRAKYGSLGNSRSYILPCRMQNVSNFYPLPSIRKIVSRSEILHFNARRLQLCLTIRFMQFLGTV